MKRWLTALVAVPVALAAIFLLPQLYFFLLCALTIGLAVLEYMNLTRFWAPQAPFWALPPLVLASAAPLALLDPARPVQLAVLFGVGTALSVGLGCLILFGRTPVGQALPALGGLAFGIPYFALPIASLTQLQRLGPWFVFLLVAIVWLGDTAAYYVGRRWGRRRLAPVVSPNKTWAGAAASLTAAAIATLLWCHWYLGDFHLGVFGAAIATGVAAQVGDLVESMLKRGAGVKDSGNLLPGHGGMLDRGDALFFAAPIFWLGLLLLAPEVAAR